MYRTEIASQDEIENWSQLIASCPYSEPLHTIEWRDALAASFSQLEPIYFIIRDDNDSIAGAFPCFSFRPVPFSKTLLSMPWTLPGGPLVFSGADVKEATLSVCGKLDEISRERHSFETSFTLPPHCDIDIGESLLSAGYVEESSQFTHILDVENGYEEIRRAYNKGVKAAVTQSGKLGVTVRETEGEAEMAYFYKLYLAQMKRFDSTPKPYSLFRYLQTSPIARFIIAELDDKIIGGILFLHFNSRVRFWCQVSDREFLKYRPNNATIDYMIQWSCRNGCRFVDFGASPPEHKGLITFKEDWGAKKAWFSTFVKLHSAWRKKLWTTSEPSLRRAYAAIQRFKVRNV